MAFCPANCSPVTLVPNLGTECELKPRTTGIDRIGFFSCLEDLPSPMSCQALTVLANANALVFSSPLALITVNDPEQEELEISQCRAPMRITTRRVIDFQDRIKVEQTATSPAVSNLFYDYDFWKDKKTHTATMRYLFVMCDGTVRVAKDENGNYLEANLNVFLSFERQGTGGTAYDLEIKKAQLDFKGDPFDFIHPEEDVAGIPFNINACNLF